MKSKNACAVVLAMALSWIGKPAVASVTEAVFDPVEYVNPLIGTQSTFQLSTGNTYPALKVSSPSPPNSVSSPPRPAIISSPFPAIKVFLSLSPPI